MIGRFFKKLWSDYFEVFTEDTSHRSTEQHPEFTIFFYRGRKKRKLIATQYTD